MTNKNQLHFEPIQNSEEIRRTLTTFNAEAPNYSDRAKNLLRQTSYWVFDPTAQTFGPSKFIGLRNMNFSQYNLALEMRSTGKLTHFDGNVTQTEIEKYLGEYKPSQELSSKLIDWGERLFGAGVFDNVTKNKWKFTSLLPVESSNTTTYLLTWNPERWHWDNIQNDLASIKKQGYCLGTWSCGVTKKILPDDRVFLIKLGKEEPRGIVASGWATSEVFEDEHWDEEAALEEKTALYIDVHFDTILDPEKTIFPRQKLDKGIYVKMNWQPQASGVTIPDDVASQLEIDWAKC